MVNLVIIWVERITAESVRMSMAREISVAILHPVCKHNAAGGAEPACLRDPNQLEEHGQEALSGHSCGASHVGYLEAL